MDTNYNELSLVNLKKLAKGRRIKLYYTKSIHELRWLLSQPDLPAKYKIEKLTIKQLREEAKEKGVRGFWNLSRGDLVALLYPNGSLAANEKDQYGNDSEKHNSPQSNNSHQVRVENLQYAG
jgi:hypothetical protein